MLISLRKNNMYLRTRHTDIMLDTQTLHLRRYAFKTSPSILDDEEKLRIVDMVSVGYDTMGRLVYLKHYTPSGLTWFKLLYNTKGQLQSYQDHQGQCWERHWGVPFFYEGDLMRMIIKEKSIRENINLNLSLGYNNATYKPYPRSLTPPYKVNIETMGI